MKKKIFTGSGTAIITPFIDNKVDYNALGRLIEFQISKLTDAIIICGTTGEASTLSDDEHREVISFAINKVAKRIPVIAGTGSNDTAYAVELSQYAESTGADALLLVTPYYNKATQKGLAAHFLAIADAVSLPIILYNVPSRTNVNITPATYKKLSGHKNIIAVKEASGNMGQIGLIKKMCGDSLEIYSGNDTDIVPVLSLGGIGVISVLSNLLPLETHNICDLYMNGKIRESMELQIKYAELIDALFCEVNPIPIKTAMAVAGYCTNELRLPLCEMEPKNKELLLSAMREVGIK